MYCILLCLIFTVIHTLNNIHHSVSVSSTLKTGSGLNWANGHKSDPKKQSNKIENTNDNKDTPKKKNEKKASSEQKDTKAGNEEVVLKPKGQQSGSKPNKPAAAQEHKADEPASRANDAKTPQSNVDNYNKANNDKTHKFSNANNLPIKQGQPKVPLFKRYCAGTVDLSKMSLQERVESRHRRHRAYLKEYDNLTPAEKDAENIELRDLYFMLEWNELDSFKAPIAWAPEDYDKNGLIQPAGKKVLVLTANDGKGNSQIGGVLEAAMENRIEYCNYHGYINYFVNLTKYIRPGVHPVWSKVAAIREAFEENPGVEWVWWLDTDAIITNPQYAVAEHILNPKALEQRVTYGRPMRSMFGNWTSGIFMEPGEIDFDNVDMVITQDFYGLNAGSFFIKRSTFTSVLLDIWDDPLQINHKWERLEQDALAYLFHSHDVFQRHIALAPQRLFNSYTDKPGGVWSWQPGDFVIHLAGCNEQGVCESSFHKYWNQRIQVPKEHWVEKRIDLNYYKKNIEAF